MTCFTLGARWALGTGYPYNGARYYDSGPSRARGTGRAGHTGRTGSRDHHGWWCTDRIASAQ